MSRTIALALFVSLAALMPSQASAQAVELNPGYISGTVAVTGHTVTQASISAYWMNPADGATYQASTNVSGGGTYTLTVNVPAGTSPSYTVSATVYLDNYQYNLSLPSQAVPVTAAATSTADFSITPGYLQATVSGASLSSSYFYAYGGGGSSNGNGGSSGSATFPVIPDASVNVYGYAYFTVGGYEFLNYQTVSVAAGETVSVSWTVTAPVVAGSIEGAFSLNGATPNQTYIQASGNGGYGSASLTENGPYNIPNLIAGSYYVYAYSYFNNYASYMQFPDSSFSPGRNATVTSGPTRVDISATTASISGRLSLTGTKTLSQASYASMSAYGAYPGPASGGYASTQANLQTGAYSFVVTDGNWSPYVFSFGFSDSNPSAYLNAYLSFYDYASYYNPISLTAGETATRNLTYGTGTVTVNFTALGGATLSSPSLSGSCYRYAPDGQLVSYYYVNAYGNASNVAQGSVTFVGMAGTCTLDAWATVGGSNTQFGRVTIEVVPGTDVVIDIGGPALTVTYPEAGLMTTRDTITVTGSATDDLAVTGVTVNGAAAALDPAAGGPSVTFSTPISLSMGPNEIVTVATDGSGKIARDRRTVYRDNGPPELAWTPPDGSTSSVADITVEGTATDDAGIASVTVNGAVVYESPTPGSGPTSVQFSTPFTLQLGLNYIEVVATDISTRMTAQTHVVKLSEEAVNQPPTADSQRVTTPEDTPVGITLTGSDPDGNTLTYMVIDGPSNGRLSGRAPDLTYSPDGNFCGRDSFTFRVNDGTVDSDRVAVVSIDVTCVNDPPFAQPDSKVTPEDTPLLNEVLPPAVDPDGGPAPLSYALVGGPMVGASVALSPNGTYIYSPAPNFTGLDSFTYSVSDGGVEPSNVATVTIDVTPVPDAPVGVNDELTIDEDSSGGGNVLDNDTDADTDHLLLSVAASGAIVTPPVHGTATLSSDGIFTYRPDRNYHGSDSFTYRASDGALESDLTTVAITITPLNDPPIAGNDSTSTAEEVVVAGNVLPNDSDTETASADLRATLVSGVSHGLLMFASNGDYIYTPAPNYYGTDSFTYKVNDESLFSNEATVNITITSVNDSPVCALVVPNVSVIWPPNHKLVTITLSGATDLDGDALTYLVTGIFQDEVTNGSGDGNTSIDGFGVGTSQAQVRAERSGRGNGRVYHLQFRATDANGASCTGEVTVGVPHDKKHAIVDGGAKYDSTKPSRRSDEDEHHGCGDRDDHDRKNNRDRDDHNRQKHGGGAYDRNDEDNDRGYNGRDRDNDLEREREGGRRD